MGSCDSPLENNERAALRKTKRYSARLQDSCALYIFIVFGARVALVYKVMLIKL